MKGTTMRNRAGLGLRLGLATCCCAALAACTAGAPKGPNTTVSTPSVGRPPPPASAQAALSGEAFTPYAALGISSNDGLAPGESQYTLAGPCMSGAGYPGVASLDILGNVIPFISKEEEKMEEETRKLLGKLNGAGIVMGSFGMSAQCNRVAVEDGHTESVSVKLTKKAKPEEIITVWNEFRSLPQEMKLPSAPEQPVRYMSPSDRPQPRLDVDSGNGMTTSVGRLRPCGVLDWKFTVLSHNTIRGAAGAALLNAELLKVQGYLG